MAWISVHGGVFGPKLRDLYRKLKCSEAEALGILNILWLWGLENANADGLIISAEKEDIERAIYAHNAKSKIAVGVIADALIETGWIDVEPKGYYIHDWEIWQEQWYKAKERRESDAKRKRESRKRSSTSGDTKPADVPSDSPQDIPADTATGSKPSQKKGEKKGDEPAAAPEEPQYTPEFALFWDAYPRKIGKGEAYKKYKARRNDGYSPEQLLTAAKNYASQVKKAKTDKQYIKHPKTFLSDTMPFVDFLPKKQTMNPAPETAEGGNPFRDWEGGN